MVLAVIAVAVLLVIAFAATAGAFDRPARVRRRERVIVEQPVQEVVTERRVVRDRPL